MTTIGLLVLKFYWAGRHPHCDRTLGYILVIIYDSMFYFFVTRTTFFLCTPWLFLIGFWFFQIWNRRQRNRRTRRFRRLPTYKFKDYERKFGPVSHKEWWICLDEYQDQDEVYEFPCDHKHLFHKDWIKQWYEKSDSCPVDRTNFNGGA